MAMTLEEIEREISALDASEKGEILKYLIAELDFPGDTGVEEAWLHEVNRRYDELANGKANAIPAEKVMRKARDRLKDVS